MMGFEAAGAAPIVRGHPVARPETIASAIRIGNPASWAGAVAAREESGGAIEAIEDEDILAAYHLVARTEGVFVEPASAISIAGLRALSGRGIVRPGDVVVCTLTGHGLKDPDVAIANAEPPVSIPADQARLAAAVGLR
jgi:threonine synthase